MRDHSQRKNALDRVYMTSSNCERGPPACERIIADGSVYPHYDIVIWSQTHWRWLESKLVELGVLGGARAYKICFVSDRTTMFPVSESTEINFNG